MALIGGAIFFFVSHPCSDIFPCHDTAAVVAAERRELLLSAERIFKRYQASPYKPRQDLMPRPLHVGAIQGPEATVTVDGPIASNAVLYAAEWYDIYHRHHGGTRPVILNVAWKSGHRIQTYPISEF
ncbi:MAG: hypothetical protein JWM87_3906 [Candidatus Eremiobacteraeota bacterium]|nr:hypothetical protein [Candidatus Eremiobacteraeota bacterium]